jgi:hypothetical protein
VILGGMFLLLLMMVVAALTNPIQIIITLVRIVILKIKLVKHNAFVRRMAPNS